MIGTILLFIKEMYRKKTKFFSWLIGSVFSGRAGMLTNYLFLFSLLSIFLVMNSTSCLCQISICLYTIRYDTTILNFVKTGWPSQSM